MKLCSRLPQEWSLDDHALDLINQTEEESSVWCSFEANKKRDTKELIYDTERDEENSNINKKFPKKETIKARDTFENQHYHIHRNLYLLHIHRNLYLYNIHTKL